MHDARIRADVATAFDMEGRLNWTWENASLSGLLANRAVPPADACCGVPTAGSGQIAASAVRRRDTSTHFEGVKTSGSKPMQSNICFLTQHVGDAKWEQTHI